MHITVWNEFRHEKKNPKVISVYPDGIHKVIAEGLREHGLTDEVLAKADVLLWWGHMAHGEVSDAVVDKVQQRVLEGMGLIVLHSGHFSKIFKRLMGTTCNLKWREAGEKERLWVMNPAHPIADGLSDYFEIEHTEMYGEPFGIPEPDSLVFVSWFAGGEVFRSGCCYYRGQGKVFYFRPGHETFPIYYNKDVRKVIANAVNWAAPTHGPKIPIVNAKVSLEPLPPFEG